MKSMRILPLSLVLLTLMAILPIGCSDDDGNGINNSVPLTLVGTWRATSATVDGVPQDLAELFDWDPGVAGTEVTLNGNGTYASREYDASNNTVSTESGTFEVTGSTMMVTVTVQDGSDITPEEGLNAQWSVSGNTLTLTQAVGGSTIVLTLTRVTT